MDSTALLQQLQQQNEALQLQFAAQAAQGVEAMRWFLALAISSYVVGAIISFFVARWFLLHVLGIQQKRFFAQLDLFLYQRGIAPHVAESYPAPPRSQPAASSRVKEIAKDLVATVDKLAEPTKPKPSAATLDETPLERAWRELEKSNKPSASPEDSKYMPKQ